MDSGFQIRDLDFWGLEVQGLSCRVLGHRLRFRFRI